jgi:hypothetical protein
MKKAPLTLLVTGLLSSPAASSDFRQFRDWYAAFTIASGDAIVDSLHKAQRIFISREDPPEIGRQFIARK